MSQPQSDDGLRVAEDDAESLPLDNGWALWDTGRCSITRCLEPPVAAVERAARPRRPAHLQPYCEEHAHARGVERHGDALAWTAAYLAPTTRAGHRAGHPAGHPAG